MGGQDADGGDRGVVGDRAAGGAAGAAFFLDGVAGGDGDRGGLGGLDVAFAVLAAVSEDGAGLRAPDDGAESGLVCGQLGKLTKESTSSRGG